MPVEHQGSKIEQVGMDWDEMEQFAEDMDVCVKLNLAYECD